MNEKDWTNDLRHKLEGHREEVSDDLWARIEQSLDAQTPKRKAVITPLRRWAAAAVITGIAAGAMLFWHNSNEPMAEMQEDAITEEQVIPTTNDNEFQATADSSTSPTTGEDTHQSSAPSINKTQGLLAQRSKDDKRPAERYSAVRNEEKSNTTIRDAGDAGYDNIEKQPSEGEKAVDDGGKAVQQTTETAVSNSKDATPEPSIGTSKPSHGGTIYDNGENFATNTAIFPTSRGMKNNASFKLFASGPMSSNSTNSVPETFFMANTVTSFYSVNKAVNTVSYKETKHRRPFTVGLSYKHPLGNHLWASGGLTYTRLQSEFTSQMISTSLVEEQSLHYIGIPLSLGFTIWQKGHFSTYGSAGFQTDFNVKSTIESNGQEKSIPHDRIQFSALAGLGAEYDFSQNAGVFIEPQLKYYPDNGSDIDNYFKEKNWRVNLEFGVRIIY